MLTDQYDDSIHHDWDSGISSEIPDNHSLYQVDKPTLPPKTTKSNKQTNPAQKTDTYH